MAPRQPAVREPTKPPAHKVRRDHRGWDESIIIGFAEAGKAIATRPLQLTGRTDTAFGGARAAPTGRRSSTGTWTARSTSPSTCCTRAKRLAALHLAREMPKEMCIPVRIVGVTAGGITVQTRRMARASSMWRRHRFPRGSSAHRHSVEDRLADGDDQRADRHQDDGYHRRRWHVGAGLGNLRVEDER